jgi:glutamate decarboxylase
MVFLTSVKNDDQVFDPKSHSIDSIAAPQPNEDDFYTNVYGSHFAADHLPQHEMAEQEMPRQVAARMIKDELSLDGNPKLK